LAPGSILSWGTYRTRILRYRKWEIGEGLLEVTLYHTQYLLMYILCYTLRVHLQYKSQYSISMNSSYTVNEGQVRIQYKCLVSIDVSPDMKLLGLFISKTEL
jgi:hypothetical protein